MEGWQPLQLLGTYSIRYVRLFHTWKQGTTLTHLLMSQCPTLWWFVPVYEVESLHHPLVGMWPALRGANNVISPAPKRIKLSGLDASTAITDRQGE